VDRIRHVLAITLVIGSISIVDLRLLGVTSLDRAVSRLMGDVLPFTWGAFVVAAIMGALLFASNAATYGHNFFFLGKMILIALADINMAGLSFFRRPRHRALGQRGASSVRRQDRRRAVVVDLDCGGRFRPLDRLHIALNFQFWLYSDWISKWGTYPCDTFLRPSWSPVRRSWLARFRPPNLPRKRSSIRHRRRRTGRTSASFRIGAASGTRRLPTRTPRSGPTRRRGMSRPPRKSSRCSPRRRPAGRG